MRRWSSVLATLLLLILCTGCSSAIYRRGEYICAYHQGDFSQAEQTLSQTIEKEMPCGDYCQSNDATWLLLDRATTRFAMGDIQGAIVDYNKALEALDFYSQDLPIESLNKVLLQDESGAYEAEDFEQVLARVYLALALMHQGDLSNASAILRQAEEWQQRRRSIYADSSFTSEYQLIDNALGKYLFAALLEKRGDSSNADILYKQAESLSGIPCAHKKNSEEATLLIICHNGNAPYKVSGVSDASIASTVALEILLCANGQQPKATCMSGIPVPVLCNWYLSEPIPTYSCVDNVQNALLPYYNIEAVAQEQLNQKLPVIVARGVARYIIRRSTVACAQRQDPNLGALMDLGMLIANLNTKADTRSWTTLPAVIDLARYDVSAGEHTLTLQIQNRDGTLSQHSYELALDKNDLCVINIFNIHPGISTIHVPSRFLRH